jgi:rRNA maturation RNase YbeY
MYAVHTEMEEILEQSDQPPPSVTIQGDASEHHAYLKENTVSALDFLKKVESEISIRIVNDETMSTLHSKHSGIEGSTDVLTFDRGSDEDTIRADIAICFDVAEREAEPRKNSIQNEMLLYILHGLLHCCGFDDHDDATHQEIHAEEDRILTAIGIGAVWSNVT